MVYFQIESETVAAEEKSQETLDKVETLQVNLAGLQQKIGENEYKVQQAENEAKNAADLANKASEVSCIVICQHTKYIGGIVFKMRHIYVMGSGAHP